MYELDSVEIHGQEIEKGDYYEHPSGLLINIEAYEDDTGDTMYYASVNSGYGAVELRAFSSDSPETAIDRLGRHPAVRNAIANGKESIRA